MNFQEFSNADPVIVVHVICGLCAFIIGPIALYSNARQALHRAAGYLWVFSMILLAGTSFFIDGLKAFGRFGPIHLLSVLTLWSIFEAMRQIYQGNMILHRRIMTNLYWYGLVIAGLFNFLPGRLVNIAVLGDASADMGYVVIISGAVCLLGWHLKDRRKFLARAAVAGGRKF